MNKERGITNDKSCENSYDNDNYFDIVASTINERKSYSSSSNKSGSTTSVFSRC